MGVVGAGKTTVGSLLARELGWEFVDADSFHSPANVEKIRLGIPLEDADRAPWLKAIRQAMDQWIAKLGLRQGHFATEKLLASQFAILEEPEEGIALDVDQSPADMVEEIRGWLGLEPR